MDTLLQERYMNTIDINTIASKIDHTILKADAQRHQIIEYCRQAKEQGFASVCVNPCHVPLVAAELKGSNVKVCTVIGFPLGADSSDTKAYAAGIAVKEGAQEIDMVINIGALKDGDHDYVEKDIKKVVEASGDALVKVIIETCYLTDEEKIQACKLAVKAGAHFVKTSTGFGTAGAAADDVRLMKEIVGEGIGVKASGGVRSYQEAMDMLNAGADRIGTSSGLKIIGEMK
jgi:deoxyribose-phosphate aldolase